MIFIALLINYELRIISEQKANKDDGVSDSSGGDDQDDDAELEMEMEAADAEEGG